MSAIIYGPQGCGKTRNKEIIAKQCGLTNIIDNWKQGIDIPDNTIALTNIGFLSLMPISPLPLENCISFYRVMTEVEIAQLKIFNNQVKASVHAEASPQFGCEIALATNIYEQIKKL